MILRYEAWDRTVSRLVLERREVQWQAMKNLIPMQFERLFKLAVNRRGRNIAMVASRKLLQLLKRRAEEQQLLLFLAEVLVQI